MAQYYQREQFSLTLHTFRVQVFHRELQLQLQIKTINTTNC